MLFAALFWLLLLAGLLDDIFTPYENNIGRAVREMSSARVRFIGTAMYQYSLDHNGEFPTGKSSTEVFQKLIDGHYVSNPNYFFLYRGYGSLIKTEPTSNTLKPENVCFDVTVPIRADSPKGLPVVFVTGYKITYEPGADAVFLSTYSLMRSTTAVAYMDDRHPSALSIMWSGRFNVLYYHLEYKRVGSEVVHVAPHFIPSDFDPKDQKYQQLTPDGPLAP